MASGDRSRRTFLKNWLSNFFSRLGGAPQNRDDLVRSLRDAGDRHLMDSEALSMMEGVLQVSDLQVRDIMIPRAQMTVIGRDDPFEDVLPVVVNSKHSRFPVIGEDKGEVVGILLAKDLLQYCGGDGQRFSIRDVLRSAVFVPESKRLNVLLREFRVSRNHMAIVIDEYGGAAGLVTIEDVLEQIVGEIEDEYDFDEGAFILKRDENQYTAKAHTRIDDFNEYFGTEIDDTDFDTIGGLVVHAYGRVPKSGESIRVAGFSFTVVRADSRRIRLLNISRLTKSPEQSEQSN